MKITREALKTIVKETMIEESEYQDFFKRALEKAGGSIPKMSEEEKKAFFNKIEKTWKGKGEKNKISETELEEAQSPAQKAAFEKMLAKKDGKDESVVAESFADPLEGFPQAYKDLLKKLQRSNDRGERSMLINKMNVIRKKLKLKPLTNESVNEADINEAFGNDRQMKILHTLLKDKKFMDSSDFNSFFKKLQKDSSNYFKGETFSLKKLHKDYKTNPKGFKYDDNKYRLAESVNEAEIRWGAVDNAIIKYIKYNVKVLEKPIKARDEALTKKMLKGFIDGLVNAQRSLNLKE